MKAYQLKNLLLTLGAVFCFISVAFGQNSYFTQFYNPGTGNPGQQNQQQDFDQTGWTAITVGTDSLNEWSNSQSLPFAFDFYGVSVSSYRVSNNGLITFDTASSPFLPVANNTNLPSDSLPPMTIACFWDAFTSAPPTGSNDIVDVRTFGSFPKRQFWIRWYSFEMGNPSADFNYFACILEESTNKVMLLDMGYHALAQNLSATAGLQFDDTLGVQYGDSTLGLTAGTSSDVDNVWYEFCPYNPMPVNVKVETIDAPKSSCGLSSAEPVKVTIQNLGTDTLYSIPVCFTVNGSAGGCDTISATVAPLDYHSFTFSDSANVSAAGNHTIKVWSYAAADGDSLNDTLEITINNIAPINTFPYVQDFDSWTNDLFEPVPLNDGWENVQGEGPQDWYVHKGPTATGNTGPIADHTSGSGNYLYMEDSNNDNDSVDAITPCFDLTGITAAVGFWVHSVEANGGSSNVNELYLQVWDGFTYTTIDTISHLGGTWTFVQNSLSSFTNETISFRLRGNNNNSSIFHDIAIDDFRVWELLPDNVGIAGFSKPKNSSCSLGNETICVYVTNYGSNSTSGNIPVTYAVGTDTVTEMVSATLNPQDTVIYCFSMPADLSTSGSYTITAWTSYSGDTTTTDDSSSISISHMPSINSFPYQENFENGPGFWESDGMQNSWAFGTPNKGIINGANSGSQAWMTGGLTGDYNLLENSYVKSPCFDFTGLLSPWFQAHVWWSSESGFDGAALQYSLDTGNTWTHLGTVGDPNAWYTSSTTNAMLSFVGNGNSWTGGKSAKNGSGGWTCVNHDLSFLSGNPMVQFRFVFASDGTLTDNGFAFDDILITAGPPSGISIGPDTAVCDTNYILTAGIPSGQFLWSTGANTPALQVDTTGQYWMRVIGNNGFCAYDTADIGILGLPVINIGPDTTLCGADTLVLDVGGITDPHVWNTGDTAQTMTVDSTDTYYVTVTNANNCSYTDSIFVVSLNSVVVDIGPDTTLCANFYTIDAGIPLQSYTWNTGASTQIIYPTSSGTYSVTVNSACGTDSDTMNLILFNLPPVNLGPDQTVCDSFTLDAGAGAVSYAWSNGATTQTTTVDSTGQFYVDVVDTNGCTNSDSVFLVMEKTPVTAISADTSNCPIVIFQEIQLGGATTTWNWDLGDGVTSTAQNPTHTYSKDSTYTISLTAQNVCGSNTGTMLLTIDCIVSTSTDLAIESLVIYPNPAQDQLVVVGKGLSNGKYDLRLIDVHGKVVQEELVNSADLKSGRQLNVSELSQGIYFLQVSSDGGQVSRRIEISR